MHEQSLLDGGSTTVDQFQSFHQEGDTLLVLSVVLPCLGQYRSSIASALLLCQEGLSTRDVSRRLGVNQSDVARTWRRYRDTGTVDDMPRSGMQWMTATYGFQLGGTLTATPPC